MTPSPLRSASGGLFTVGGSLRTTAPTAGDAIVLQTFTQTNTSASSTSAGLVRMPLHFKDGDMLASSIPQVEIQGGAEITNIQFSARTTWNSGALKRCICYFRDTTFSTSETRTYDVRAKSGSYNDTPAFTTTDITNEADLKVNFTNVLLADLFENKSTTIDTTSGSSTVEVQYNSHGRVTGDRIKFLERGSIGGLNMDNKVLTVTVIDVNNFTFVHPAGNASSTANDSGSAQCLWYPNTDLNDHEAVFSAGVAVNLDLTAYEAGPEACSWMLTQQVKDSVTTTLDGNLWVRWYITARNDGTDTINGNLEILAMPMIITYGVAGRAEMSYTATLIDNVTTIQEYADVKHLANGMWGTVRMDDDPEHGKPHWLTTSQIPTLIAKHDAAYMAEAFIIPPYPLIGDSIPAESKQTYIPMHNLGYRANTNASGSYTGRGPMNPQDVTALLKADQQSWRTSRTDAWHAMHYPVHYREEASDTIISLVMGPKNAAEYDFTADGLEAARIAYWGGDTTARDRVVAITSLGKWDVGTGRDGYEDSTHQMSPAFGSWMLTGYRYYLDGLMGTAQKSIMQDSGSVNKIFNAEVASRVTAWSIDITNWNALFKINSSFNHRYLGWAALSLGQVAGLIPDDDKHANFWKKLNEHNGDMCTAAISYLPQAWLDNGHFLSVDNSSKSGPRYYFDLMNTVSFRYNSMLTEDPGFKSIADLGSVYVKNKFEMNHVAWSAYNSGERTDLEDLDPVASTPHGPTDMFAGVINASITSSVVTATCPGSRSWTANDKVIFLTYDGEKVSHTIAPEAPKGVVKYVVNPTAGTSFQLSDTEGGAAITFAGNHSNMVLQAQWQDEKVSGASINGDHYDGMACTVMRMAHNLGTDIVDQTLADEVNTYANAENYTAGGNKLHYASRDLT